jgi:hypothetical protein
MNEATFNTKTSTSRLTKAGIILLVISLIFSVFCFVLGGIVLNEEDSEYNSGSKKTVYISSARKQLLDAYSGQTIQVEYTPSSSGTYKFYTKSAILYGVEDGSGYTKSTSYESNDRSSQYDSCCSVYLSSYETYYFEVYVSYGSPAVYIVLD